MTSNLTDKVPAVNSLWHETDDPVAVCRVKAVVIVVESSVSDEPILLTPDQFRQRFTDEHAFGNYLERHTARVLDRVYDAMSEERKIREGT